jgi:hypothetical protein
MRGEDADENCRGSDRGPPAGLSGRFFARSAQVDEDIIASRNYVTVALSDINVVMGCKKGRFKPAE